MTLVQTKPLATDESTRAALIDLLYRLADDNLALGHRDSEWTGLGPILEADIAFSSMSQDKIGHAIAFYTLLHELGEPDPDTLVYTRKVAQFRCCSLCSMPRGDWAVSTARQFLYAEAAAVRMEALTESAYKPLADLARKLHGELKYHVMHGRMWIERLGNSTSESHVRMQSALEEVWPHALGIFEPTEADEVLAEAGIQPTEEELLGRWRKAVEPILLKSGLKIPKNAHPIHGGRSGRHGESMQQLLDDLHKVNRLAPGAKW